MTNTKDVILKLKEVKKEKGLSLDKILVLIEKNGDFISKSTLARVFKDGSENSSFRYEETLRPIADALLDIQDDEDNDDTDTKAYKAILRLKKELIIELESKLETVESEEKTKYLEKLAAETEKFQRSLDYIKHQVELKDKRIDKLMDANDRLTEANNKLIAQFLDCPIRNKECR